MTDTPIIDIFGRRSCYFCQNAENLVNKKGLSGTVYYVPEHVTAEWLLAKYPMFHNEQHIDSLALPIILNRGELVGGYIELMTFLASYPDVR